MKYTKEIPTKPGWYWARNGFGKRIVEFRIINKKLILIHNSRYKEPHNRFEYAGPIEEPEE